jgi:hypothetical protein
MPDEAHVLNKGPKVVRLDGAGIGVKTIKEG